MATAVGAEHFISVLLLFGGDPDPGVIVTITYLAPSSAATFAGTNDENALHKYRGGSILVAYSPSQSRLNGGGKGSIS